MEKLTTKEVEVMGLIIEGLSNAQIASSLSVSINTTKTHVSNILRKKNAKSRAQLISNQLKK